MGSILTISDLMAASHDEAQYYLKQVTVEADLYRYLKWLFDAEVTTEVDAKLKRHRKRPPGIHPSSAAKKGVCLLKLHYECTDTDTGNDAYDLKAQLTWDIGTLLHELYQTWFYAMYENQFQAEVPLTNKAWHITGNADGVFQFAFYRFVLEMKSIKEGGNYGWEKVQAKPMEDHVRQTHFYMKAADVPYGLIFYINKNAGEIKEHAVMFNPELWQEIETDVLKPVIAAAYNNGPAVKASPGWHCRWCNYQNSCPERSSRGAKGVIDVAW